MGKAGTKPIIGIIGGIGSGKSAVAAELGKLGCKVIDADRIAHELLEKKSVKDKILTYFGPEILNLKGKIDRRKLAEIVFADAGKLASLNRVIHPLVLKKTEKFIEAENMIRNISCKEKRKKMLYMLRFFSSTVEMPKITF